MNFKSLSAAINKTVYFPKTSKFIFLIAVVAFSFFYNYQQILFLAPQSLHQWRQSDCLSITMNYYQDGNSFFQPSIHNLGNDVTGKTISEFPIVYYTVAQLWKLFGKQEMLFRLLNLALFFIGLYALFRLIEKVLVHSVYALIFSLLLFTSPMLVYYANNFLMNSTALSFSMIAFYFFIKFIFEGKNKYLALMAIFYALAGLLKITSLLSCISIFFIFILEVVGFNILSNRKLFEKPQKQWMFFCGILVTQIIWYLYVSYYNQLHNGGVFLVGVLPFWNINYDSVQQILLAFIEHFKWDYFRFETQIVFILMFLVIFFKAHKGSFLFSAICVSMSLGFLCIIILFFEAIKDHDYYLLDSLFIIPIILIAFFLYLKTNFPRVYGSLALKIILVAFLIHNLDFARRRMEDRYSITGWQNENYVKKVQVFEKINPYLNSLGINKDDKIISLSDQSINITLYLMNRKGWTNYNIKNDSTNLSIRVMQGAKYLMVYDDIALKDKTLNCFFKNKIGQYKFVQIFKL